MEISTYHQQSVAARVPLWGCVLSSAAAQAFGRAVEEKPCTTNDGSIHEENVGQSDPPSPAAMLESLKRVRAGSEYHLNYPLFNPQW